MDRTRLAFAACLVILVGCQVPPVKPSRIAQEQLAQRPPAPQPVFSDMDHTLAYLGDQLREQKIQPTLIGYAAIADTTGKTGVDFVALARSALSKIIVRGSALAATSNGFGPSAKPELPSVEERELQRELQRDPARAARHVRPDWQITGGSVSMTNAFISIQNTGGLLARDIDLAASGTANVDLLSLSFGMKWVDSGIDMPMRTVDVRVSYQQLSNATEVGVFAQGSINGKRRQAGLRFGRTVGVSQVAEDAIRVGIEWAIAEMLAIRYSVDLAQAPMHALTPDHLLPKAQRLPATSDLPKIWAAWSATERLQWFQPVLTTRNYAPGVLDGKPSPRTREALARAAQDHGLPPSGQPTDALFYLLAARELAHGRDPRDWRKLLAADPAAPARIQVQLAQPNIAYTVGGLLRASVVAPQAGHLHCWQASPEGPVAIYPILSGRGNFVRAGAPVLLPDTQASGAHPRLRVTAAGAHELWCGQARKNVDALLPAELRAGGSSQAGLDGIREANAKAAGVDWLAEGSVRFAVAETPAPR